MFQFKLESVLSLREKIEDSKKRELGAALQQAELIQSEKVQLQQQKAAAILEAKLKNKETVNVLYLKHLNQYNNRMDQEIKEKEKQLASANEAVEAKRKELLEAVKNRKILENLKAIHQEAFEEEEKLEEQKLLDDVVTYKYGSKGKES